MSYKLFILFLVLVFYLKLPGQSSATQLYARIDVKENKLKVKWYLPNFISEEPVILWRETTTGSWERLCNQSFRFSKTADLGSLTPKDKELFTICKNNTQISGVMLLHVLMQSFTSKHFAEVAGFAFTAELDNIRPDTRFKITGEQSGKAYFQGTAITYQRNEETTNRNKLLYLQKNAKVQLYWNNVPEEVWGLLLYRKHSDSTQHILLTPQALLKSKDTSQVESRSFIDVTPREKQNYYYHLKGITHFGDTITISSTLLYECPDQSPPHAVENLSCSAQKREVTLSWKSNQTGDCAYYEILRTQKNDTDYVVIGKIANAAIDKFQDTIKRFQSYYYKVRSFDSAANFSDCNPQAIDVPDTESPESAEFTGISADSVSILLKWKANISEDYAGCYVYRTINDTNAAYFVRITPEPVKEMQFRDVLPANTKNRYYYKLITCDSSLNYSKYSTLMSIRLPDKTSPSKVFIATIEQQGLALKISWFKNPEIDIKNYLLSIYDSCTRQKRPVIKIPRDSSTFHLANLQQNCMYTFYIQAQDSSGNTSPAGASRYFMLHSIDKEETEKQKLQLKAQTLEDSLAFKFHWRISTQDSVIGYTLYRADNREQDALPISGFITNSKHYVDSSIQNNFSYTYHLRALLYNGTILKSNSVKINTNEKNTINDIRVNHKKELFLMIFLFSLQLTAQVGVNIVTPHASAAMQIESPTGVSRGLLTPSMTTAGRNSIASGTSGTADGLIVYDINHKMHYYFQASSNKWISMAPLVLSTPAVGSGTAPSGAITTPSAAGNFLMGINKQNPNKELDVVGNAAVSGSVSVGSTLTVGSSFSVNGYPLNPLVPAGTIVMFNSSSAPSGWAICDGSNGTPDLRGRFIVASGQAASTPVSGDSNPNYSTGTTGGENFHQLSKAEIPKHTHEANADGSTISASGGAHSHAVTVKGQQTGLTRSNGFTGGTAGDSSETPTTTTNSHSHPTNEFSGAVGNGTTDGLNGQSHENRPQYFVLTFIMKL